MDIFDWTLTPYTVVFLIIASVLIGVAIVAWGSRPSPVRHTLGWLLIAIALYSFTAALDAASLTITAKVFWSKIQYLGGSSIPVFFFLFVRNLTNREKPLRKRSLALLWIIPIVTVLLVFTNEWHRLIWTHFTISPLPDSNLIVYHRGMWFWVAVAFFYIMVTLTTLTLARVIVGFPAYQRRQALLLLFALPFPWLGNIFYVFGLTPWQGFDLTPIGFAITGCLLFWGIFRLNLADLTPIARGKLFDTLNDGIFVINWDDHIVEYNRAAIELIQLKGYHPAPELINRSVDEALADMPDLAPLFRVEEKAPVILQALIEGEPILEGSQQVLKDTDGQSAGRLLIIRDITQQKQAEEILLRQQRMLAVDEERKRMGRELHDSLAQILNFIHLQARVILDQLERGDSTAAAANVARLINVSEAATKDVRTFIQDTRPILSPQNAFLPALSQYIENFRDLTGMSIHFTPPDPGIEAVISTKGKLQILRIIQEALSNARKHADANSVQVIFVQNHARLHVTISDDGKGFDPVTLPAAGHYGLKIMQERAQEADGELEIRAAPGQGTQIILSLPYVEPTALSELRKHKYLIVDDHPLVLEGIRNLLMSRGCEAVDTANSGETALEQVAAAKPDLILMDVQMPGLSGLETIKRIKQDYPEIKILMLTMSARAEDLTAAIQYGADGYILKSQSPEQLFHSIEQVVNGSLSISEEMTRRALEPRFPIQNRTTQVEVPATIYELSALELDILERVALGDGYKEIGSVLHLSPYTIKYHFNKVLNKLAIDSRAEAIRVAIQAGLIKGRRHADPQI